MSQVYRDKILNDLNEIPAAMLPKFYKIVHLLKMELLSTGESKKRCSLQGIWKGSEVDENLFTEAKKSMFHDVPL
jgi:hypothetical protein